MRRSGAVGVRWGGDGRGEVGVRRSSEGSSTHTCGRASQAADVSWREMGKGGITDGASSVWGCAQMYMQTGDPV